MEQPVKEFSFICTVGAGEKPDNVFLQLGAKAEGIQATLILTPLQAAELSRELHEAADAASRHEFYESEV